PASSRPEIRLNVPASDPDAAFVEITGLTADDLTHLTSRPMSEESWSALFRVSVKPDPSSPVHDDVQMAMVGSYVTGAGVVRFHPRFPLDPGREYRVFFDPSRLPYG